MPWTTNRTDFLQQPKPQDAYLQKAFACMEAWQRGQQEFTLQTSGSTGTPKSIEVTRKQMEASAFMTCTTLGLGKGTKALVCLNVNYIAGMMMLVRGLEFDWEFTIVEPSANPLLAFSENEHFDFVALVPMQLAKIIADPNTTQRTSQLGKVLLGGAPVSVSLEKKIRELDIPVYQSYGMTETVSHVALRALNGPDASEQYTFLNEIDFGVDDRGCLFVQGAVSDGVRVQTNDLVEIQANKFKWNGRADHIINSGGVKIVLDKVDHHVALVFDEMKLPNAFFSWWEPDEKWGQKLVLVIEEPGIDIDTEMVLAKIRARSQAYETPKAVYFVKDFIKTPTNKIDRKATFQQILPL